MRRGAIVVICESAYVFASSGGGQERGEPEPPGEPAPEAVTFPGGNSGFFTQPSAFARTLREVLTTA